MNKKLAFPIAVLLTLLSIVPAGMALADETATTAAPEASSAPAPNGAPVPLFLAPGRCVCKCTCPPSGGSVSQCVVEPPGGCGSLNGQACNPGASTCSQQDIFQSCVPYELAPVPCN